MGSIVARSAFIPPRPACLLEELKNLVWLTNRYKHKIPALHIQHTNTEKEEPKYTLLFSHGNAEDLSYIEEWLEELSESLNVNVLAYEYSGYGFSSSEHNTPLTPSEDFCYSDINAAYDYLTKTKNINPQQIVIFGRSLGTGPSVDLASKQQCGGLILQSPLKSAVRVVWDSYFTPLLPIDIFNNISKIGKVKCPVLVVHGDRDAVINVEHGKAIFKAVKTYKEYLWIKGAGHNDMESNHRVELIGAMNKFLAVLGKDPKL